jgi:hypothetical protein
MSAQAHSLLIATATTEESPLRTSCDPYSQELIKDPSGSFFYANK